MNIKKTLFSVKKTVKDNFETLLRVISISMVVVFSLITAVGQIVAVFSATLLVFIMLFIAYCFYVLGVFKLIKVIHTNIKNIK